MKKKLIRMCVWETNSSSCHSVSIADDTKEFVLDSIYPDQNGVITLDGGEFGWDWFKHNDALTKANYAAVASMNNDSFRCVLVDVIKEVTGADCVEFLCSDDYKSSNHSYIDHDSYGVCPSNREDLKQFIFNKNSWLFGGNDNGSPDPTFYHVPEYRNGKMIKPEYRYELSIEGFLKKTKYINKPTEDEIRDGLSSLLYCVKLYAEIHDPACYYFDDDNSISNQINRGNNYFEFQTWKTPIDYENGICYFVKDAYWSAIREYEVANPDFKDRYTTSENWKAIREIEQRLLNQDNSPYVRPVKFFIKELGGK